MLTHNHSWHLYKCHQSTRRNRSLILGLLELLMPAINHVLKKNVSLTSVLWVSTRCCLPHLGELQSVTTFLLNASLCSFSHPLLPLSRKTYFNGPGEKKKTRKNPEAWPLLTYSIVLHQAWITRCATSTALGGRALKGVHVPELSL